MVTIAGDLDRFLAGSGFLTVTVEGEVSFAAATMAKVEWRHDEEGGFFIRDYGQNPWASVIRRFSGKAADLGYTNLDRLGSESFWLIAELAEIFAKCAGEIGWPFFNELPAETPLIMYVTAPGQISEPRVRGCLIAAAIQATGSLAKAG